MRPLLTTEQAADRLQMSPRTLARWRINGAGPAYIEIGSRVRYDPDDLDAWIREIRQPTDATRARAPIDVR